MGLVDLPTSTIKNQPFMYYMYTLILNISHVYEALMGNSHFQKTNTLILWILWDTFPETNFFAPENGWDRKMIRCFQIWGRKLVEHGPDFQGLLAAIFREGASLKTNG